MPYEPILQILAQQWGSIMSKEWCTSHAEEFPGFTGDDEKDDEWANYHDPDESYMLKLPMAGPGPHTDAAVGTGPYIFDYWNKGPGGSWSIVKDPEYWRGWANYDTLHPDHVDRYISNYIVEWPTRRLRFLGGLSDFTAVPRMFRDEVLGQPGVDTVFPLPNLACDAAFFTFLVKDTSPYIGNVQTNGTFNELGMPPNMFNDSDVRVGFSHLINWTAYLEAAFLNEAVSPPTPIVPGLSYYDPSIGLEENPGTPTIKELGITVEPTGQKAYDLVLASKYLKSAWGQAMWNTGFTFKAVYNEGNIPRQLIAEMLRDSLNLINAANGTKFHVTPVSIPWSVYKVQWKARLIPIFIVGWLADYPDAHNFAFPFLHSVGAFSRWQGIVGLTEFPNAYVDDLIAKGIGTTIPSERQSNYTILQQYYVDNAPSIVTVQAAGRHWERDWVEAWYYNPIYPGIFVYDLYKAYSQALQGIDLDITQSITTISGNASGGKARGVDVEIWSNMGVDVTVKRTDLNATYVYIIIGLVRTNTTKNTQGQTYVGIDTQIEYSGPGTWSNVTFNWNETDVPGGGWQLRAEVYPISNFTYDTDMSDNIINGGKMQALNPGDIDGSKAVDIADLVIQISHIPSPGTKSYDPLSDLDANGLCDITDLVTLISYIPTLYPY